MKRIVEEHSDEPVDVNAEIHGGTAFAAGTTSGVWQIVTALRSFRAGSPTLSLIAY